MKEGDKLRVMAMADGQDFDKHQVYDAEILTPYNKSRNHYILILSKNNEWLTSNMLKTFRLNGGDFKIVLEAVK